MKSLAEALGTVPVVDAQTTNALPTKAITKQTAQEFCRAIVESEEFRKYLLNGITLGDLAPAVVCRILDHAWGKPVERVEVNDTTERLQVVSEQGINQRLDTLKEALRRYVNSLPQAERVTELVQVSQGNDEDPGPSSIH